MQLIKSLFASKKFIAMLSGIIGLLILKVFKVSVDPATIAEFTGLVAVYVGAQGIADNGKAAAQVQAIAGLMHPSIETMPTATAEKVAAIKAV